MITAMRDSLDVPSLTRYISSRFPALEAPCDIKQFSNGQSNPTYLLRSQAGQQYVLRRKPPGSLLSSTSHRIEREYQVLEALQSSDVPVPKIFGFCADASIIGSPFYIMEFLDGRIFEDPWLPEIGTEERGLIWKEALQTLSKLHSVDLAAVGLNRWKKNSRFYSRQASVLRRIAITQAETKSSSPTQQVVGQFPYFDQLATFFSDEETQPRERKALIHGDFKIDNLVFHKTEPRVIGVLDWELATEGHPLSDLSNFLAPILSSAEDMSWLCEQALTAELKQMRTMCASGRSKGLPSVGQSLAWYSQSTGADLSLDEFAWAAAFNSFRTAVIMQGIAARLAVGQASSAKAKPFALQTLPYALWAHERVQRLLGLSQVHSKL